MNHEKVYKFSIKKFLTFYFLTNDVFLLQRHKSNNMKSQFVLANLEGERQLLHQIPSPRHLSFYHRLNHYYLMKQTQTLEPFGSSNYEPVMLNPLSFLHTTVFVVVSPYLKLINPPTHINSSNHMTQSNYISL